MNASFPRSATFSDCHRYRYSLSRNVQVEGLVFAFFGINPSTAGPIIEDATTRKWRGFCLVNGARSYVAVNPFALRATDVRELNACADPIGPDNMAAIAEAIAQADVLIPCWGNLSKIPPRLHAQVHRVMQMIRSSGKPVKVFGLTKAGDPKHPLMLGYSTPLQDWVESV